MLQGLSAGGEFGGAVSLLTEFAPPGRRGLYGSWQSFTVALGLLGGAGAAALLATVLDGRQLYDWGWRLPFLLTLPTELGARGGGAGVTDCRDVGAGRCETVRYNRRWKRRSTAEAAWRSARKADAEAGARVAETGAGARKAETGAQTRKAEASAGIPRAGRAAEAREAETAAVARRQGRPP